MSNGSFVPTASNARGDTYHSEPCGKTLWNAANIRVAAYGESIGKKPQNMPPGLSRRLASSRNSRENRSWLGLGKRASRLTTSYVFDLVRSQLRPSSTG